MIDDQGAAAIAQQMALQPRPLGGEWTVGVAESQQPGVPSQVVVQVQDAAGVVVRFLEPDAALEVAEKMRQNARTAKGARLIVPPGAGLINGQGRQL